MTLIVAILLAFVTMISVQLVVFIQTEASPQLLGRLMSLVLIVCTLAVPLVQVFFGWLSSVLALKQIAYVIMVISVVTILLAWVSKQMFRVDDNKHPKADRLTDP